MEGHDKSEPSKTLLIRSKTPMKGITFGTVRYAYEPEAEGFWFLSVPAFRFHLSGRW